MLDYNGRVVYLGIDVHKRTYSLTAKCDGVKVKRDTIPARPEDLINYCKKFFSGATIKSAYEAGFSGFHLHRKLEASGIHNIVVHPASIEIEARQRVKNDKRDSLKIATQLEAGRLRGIHIPSEDRQLLRLVSRQRQSFARERHRIACQIKCLLHEFGLIDCDDDQRVSSKWIKTILELKCPPALKYCLHKKIDHWLYVCSQIKAIESELALQADFIEPDLHSIYQSIPGVGTVIARYLANELGDMSQFKNEKQIFSYTGFTPQEYSSGDHHRLGHISHQGNPMVRKLLVQAAWTAIDRDPSLREIFERIAAKAGAKRAIVGIARRLIGRLRACIRERKLYDSLEIEKEILA